MEWKLALLEDAFTFWSPANTRQFLVECGIISRPLLVSVTLFPWQWSANPHYLRYDLCFRRLLCIITPDLTATPFWLAFIPVPVVCILALPRQTFSDCVDLLLYLYTALSALTIWPRMKFACDFIECAKRMWRATFADICHRNVAWASWYFLPLLAGVIRATSAFDKAYVS